MARHSLCFLMLLASVCAAEARPPEGAMHPPEDYYGIAQKVREVAATIGDSNVALPEGTLLDMTDALAEAGVRPDDAAPDCPDKCTLPTNLYASHVSSARGACGGVAIAAIVEHRNDPHAEKLFALSVVWDDGAVTFRQARHRRQD